MPRENRGRNLVLLESFWAVGTILAAGLAWLLVPTFGWRSLLASSALAAVLVLWIRRSVPESPRYLAISGKVDEAKEVLARVAAVNGRPAPEQDLTVGQRQAGVPVAALWVPRLRRVTLMMWIAWFCISLAYYGIFTWLPAAFVERGFPPLQTYQNHVHPGFGAIAGFLLRRLPDRTLGPA